MPKGTCKYEGCEKPARQRDWCGAHYQRLYYRGLIPPLPTLSERFMAKVAINPETGCWEWTAGKNKDGGYGRLVVNGRNVPAHRVAYELLIGPIPADRPYVLHHCDNPICVFADPDPLVSHVYAGTHQQNMDDMVRRGRATYGGLNGRAAENATKTHCLKGHPFAGDNLYIDKNGRRGCRTCMRERGREGWRRRRLQRRAAAGE